MPEQTAEITIVIIMLEVPDNKDNSARKKRLPVN